MRELERGRRKEAGIERERGSDRGKETARRDGGYQYGESVKSNAPALRPSVRELARGQCVRRFDIDTVDKRSVFSFFFPIFFLFFFLLTIFCRYFNVRFVKTRKRSREDFFLIFFFSRDHPHALRSRSVRRADRAFDSLRSARGHRKAERSRTLGD